MNESFLAQIRAKAQQGIANRLFLAATETDSLLRAFGAEIEAKTGATPIYGPLKGREGRATEKVRDDYGGDWYELKDVVRMTFVAPAPYKLLKVRNEIRSGAVARNGLSLVKDVETFANVDTCGYSGLNFVLRLKNGRPAEIQANVPEIMYAKMSQKDFTAYLGAEYYTHLRAKFLELEGGHGHALYELYRVNPAAVAARRAALVSKAYYAYFRSFPNKEKRDYLQFEINGFKKTYPHLFH